MSRPWSMSWMVTFQAGDFHLWDTVCIFRAEGVRLGINLMTVSIAGRLLGKLYVDSCIGPKWAWPVNILEQSLINM